MAKSRGDGKELQTEEEARDCRQRGGGGRGGRRSVQTPLAPAGTAFLPIMERRLAVAQHRLEKWPRIQLFAAPYSSSLKPSCLAAEPSATPPFIYLSSPRYTTSITSFALPSLPLPSPPFPSPPYLGSSAHDSRMYTLMHYFSPACTLMLPLPGGDGGDQ